MNTTREATAHSEAIISYLQRNRQEMLEFLARLVKAESPSTVPEAQAAPMGQLAGALEDLDFSLERLPGQESGGMLIARSKVIGNAQQRSAPVRQQLLLGHCDTVWPLGTLAEMPFTIEGNIVKGPGVFDMKGGLIQIIFALRCLNVLGLKPALAPLVLINSDEETGSLESAEQIKKLAHEAERAFVLEPALGIEGRLKTARKGVGQYEITVKGQAAHAGLDPDKGASAILAMSHLIQELTAMTDHEQGLSVNVGLVSGGLRSNVIAPLCSATIDIRALTTEDAKNLEKIIESLQAPIPGVELLIEGGFSRRPLERTPGNQALWQTAQELGRGLGFELLEGTAGGGSDGNFTSQYIPTLDGLGAVGDGAHASHEFLYIDKLVERTALLALLLLS